MKRFLMLCILIYSGSSLAQKVRFELHIIKACTGKEVVSSFYALFPQSQANKNGYWSDTSYINLRDTGRYKLLIINDPGAEIPSIVNIKDTGLFIFTYHQPKVYLFYTGGLDARGYYVSCDTAINGYAEDFYENGNCRLRGTFKKGRIKDSLVTFWNNGHKKKGIYYLANSALILQFDSLGHKKSVIHDWPNKPHRLTQYIAAENHVWLETLVGGFHFYEKEFFPDGNLKLSFNNTERISYFDNGKIDTSYTWKSKHDPVTGEYLLVTRTTHNRGGNVLKKLTAEIWTKEAEPRFVHNRLKYDWVIKSVRYDKRKVVFREADVDADEYFKKYPDDL